MAAEPVCFLLRVPPQDSIRIENSFNEAADQSKIFQRTKEYLQKRKAKWPKSDFMRHEYQLMREYNPKAFENISEVSNFFTGDDFYDAYSLFFPKQFETMLENLFTDDSLIESISISNATIDLMTARRFGVNQFLFSGLGWERGNRLPGFCGNMFVSPKDLPQVFKKCEGIFLEVGREDFYARTGEDCHDIEKLFSFPQFMSKALREGNGFLALNHGHIGTFPFPNDYAPDI